MIVIDYSAAVLTAGGSQKGETVKQEYHSISELKGPFGQELNVPPVILCPAAIRA